MLRLHLDGSDENMIVYLDFFLPACKYAEMVYRKDSPEEKEVVLILKEVMDKLAKVGLEKSSVKESIEKTEKLLIKHSAKGTDSVGTHELAGRIENYLAQGKGALDVFSNQYLAKIIGFNSKWNHEKLIEFLKANIHLDQSMVSEIERMLKDDWATWLKDFIEDRNIHHQANFKVSDMTLRNGKGFVFLERSNGQKIVNIIEYVDTHWQNLVGLLMDLIHLLAAAKMPMFKQIRITRKMFISDEELAALKQRSNRDN